MAATEPPNIINPEREVCAICDKPVCEHRTSEINDDYERFFIQTPEATAVSAREIEYRDIRPKQIVVQIPLVETFERLKRHKADAWQRNLCQHLQDAAANRHIERWWAVIHAEGQAGKTSIISQVFPAWLLGHDPNFRFALAMYNVSRSQMHSSVVIQIMQSQLYRDMFPNKEGWLFEDNKAAFGRAVSKAGWMTNARREVNDGQFSFNPVGLRSGLTGAGFDWLSIDDPYKEAQEAFSELINEQMRNFYDYTVQSRVALHSCISGMFHRYAPEDFAGFLLDTGDYKYLRYASQADGDYVHTKTGQVFPDPLGRVPGEYLIPERRPAKYYEKARQNNRVWLSMFQGRPSDEEGDFFKVGKIGKVSPDKAEERLRECVVVCRAYDIASTEEAGAYSVGAKMGIRADGRVTIFDVWRERVDTAERSRNQQRLAHLDGTDVAVIVPIDPGAAGKSVVWYIEQDLQGYTVIGRPTSGSKEQRAMNVSIACNSGMLDFVEAEWNEHAKKEMRDFPLSDYKDIVDAFADGYNHLFEVNRRGLVVKHYQPQRNLVARDEFARAFDIKPGAVALPPKFTVFAGVKISTEASRPTSGVIVARAPGHSALPEDLFVLDEYKAYDANMYALFDWINERAKAFEAKDPIVWLHPDSESYYQTIASKVECRVTKFPDDEMAGLNELGWYLMPTKEAHPLGHAGPAARMYFLVDRDQLGNATPGGNGGFYHARQELATWGYDDKGVPTAVGSVIDCLRMLTHRFKTFTETYTRDEEFQISLKKYFPHDLKVEPMTHAVQQRLETARYLARLEMTEKYGVTDEEQDDFLWFLER